MNLNLSVVAAATLLLLLLFNCGSEAKPQDLATGMILVVAQAKQLAETGAAAHSEQEIEVLGQKMGGGMNLGFGDAMRQPIGRRRRRSELSQQSKLQYLPHLYTAMAWLK